MKIIRFERMLTPHYVLTVGRLGALVTVHIPIVVAQLIRQGAPNLEDYQYPDDEEHVIVTEVASLLVEALYRKAWR